MHVMLVLVFVSLIARSGSLHVQCQSNIVKAGAVD